MKINKPFFPIMFAIALVLVGVIIFILNKNEIEQESQYDATAIMNRIENLSELALVKYNYTGVIGFNEYLKLLDMNVPFTKKYFLLKYSGYVKAGLELDKVQISVDKDYIELRLPEAKIFDTVIDEKSIHVYNQSGNVFNPLKVEDFKNALIAEKKKIQASAIKEGILSNATDRAHLVLSLLLVDMNFQRIEIKNHNGEVLDMRSISNKVKGKG